MLRVLGKITVAAAGTPVQAYDGDPLLRGRAILVQTLAGNSGTVYFGGAGMDKTSGAGVMLALAKDVVQEISAPGNGCLLNPEELYLDADDAGDGAYVTVIG